MSPEELARLDVLYRQTTVHLAQVATRTRDVRLAKYLNDLTAAAHSIIYLPPRKSIFTGLLKFVTEGFGRAVVRTWRYHAASAALFVTGAVVAYYAASHDVLASYALAMPGDLRLPGSTPEQLHEVLVHGRDQDASMKFAFAIVFVWPQFASGGTVAVFGNSGRNTDDWADTVQRYADRVVYRTASPSRHRRRLLRVDIATCGE